MKFKLIIDKEKEEEVTVVAHSANELTEKIENVVNSYTGNDEIFIYSDEETRKIKYYSIDCIYVYDRKTFIIDGNGNRYRINKTLSEIENELPSYFVRINKSAIGNERRIHSFKTVITGAVDVIFMCGYRDYVSRRCFANLKRRYGI